MGYKDQSRSVRWIGALLLLVGLGAAVIGPVEMYCFYLFSEGGRFHFDGFGFGSLVFASIVWQIIGYYLIAIVCVFLGIGHLKRYRWARTLAMSGIVAWFVVGIPLTLITLLLLLSFKEMGVIEFILVMGAGMFLYPGMPILLFRFYRNDNVRLTFERADPHQYWTEKLPLPVLSLALLLFFYWLIAHVGIFFNGVSPLFGLLLSGFPGIVLITFFLMCLAVLAWGTFHAKLWAWWGTLILLCSTVVSILLTFVPLSFQDIVSAVNLPTLESKAMQGIPVQGFHLALFISLPLLVTLGLLIASKPYYQCIANNTALGEKI